MKTFKKLSLAMGAIVALFAFSQPAAALKWDVNGDGSVTSVDVTVLYNYLLNDIMVYPETAYDVDGDGHITSNDITEIYNVMLNGQPTPVVTEYTANGVSFVMVTVDGGSFTMGAMPGDDEAHSNEFPAHRVKLSTYAIGQTEVTQELWTAVMGNNPAVNNGGGTLAVEKVSWNDCQQFIAKLNELTGENFRLPTEAEWEFAARGGNLSKGYLYSGSNNVDDVAWYDQNSGNSSHGVAQKAANELGLFDMSGNVWEWVNDWNGNYSAESQVDPLGPDSETRRVFRGGSWFGESRNCRVSNRFKMEPDFADDDIGFRLAK